MKKLLALLLVLALVASSLAGCGGAEDTGDTPSGDAELTVGFIYIGPKTDGGFSEAQDRGRQAMVEYFDGRVKTLEMENVPEEKQAVESAAINMIDQGEDGIVLGRSKDSAGRDTTKFILDGKKYGKNRLVLAIIKKYVAMNPDISAEKLLLTFDRSLQGSLGVVRTLEDVKENCSDYKTRFFTAPDEIIHTSSKDCVVCTQWGIGNIGNIVIRAEQLGIQVQVIK